ncbi:MAG: M1 family metallopeptidase, partial [Ilumatobacteraceae bacterium]
VVLLVALVAASCSSTGPVVSVRSASAIPIEPTDSTDATPDITTPAEDGSVDGVGDELFPSLGNPGIDVVDYAVRLRYDPQLDAIDGSVSITIAATEQRDSFTLDAVGLDIGAVAVDGVDAEFAPEDVELRITPDQPLTPGRRLVVDIAYSGTPDAGSSSVLPSGWFHTDGGSYVLNEPDGARTWLPSNDHPSDKASWTFEITVPTGMAAVANGALQATTPGPDGDTWTWRQDDLMPTYLVQLLTGDYQIIETTGPNGLPIVSAILRRNVVGAQAYIDAIPEQIDFFDDVFGPYPLDRYGIAVTDSFAGLAMETMGRSMFSNQDLDGTVGFLSELLLSHELVHQWFGDAVTPARWQDIWLNESFATYGQWLWFDHTGRATLADQASRALAGRRGAGAATGRPGADDLFGYNSYDGGAVVLQALRDTIGDDAFFTVLQRWVAENNGTSRTTEDFIALAEDVSDTDLTSFFDTWLFAAEVPTAYPSSAI